MWVAGACELGEGSGVYFITQRLVGERVIGPLSVKGHLHRSHPENDGPMNLPHFIGFPSGCRAEPRLKVSLPNTSPELPHCRA